MGWGGGGGRTWYRSEVSVAAAAAAAVGEVDAMRGEGAGRGTTAEAEAGPCLIPWRMSALTFSNFSLESLAASLAYLATNFKALFLTQPASCNAASAYGKYHAELCTPAYRCTFN